MTGLAAVMLPGADGWCQRWRDHHHSWRHRSEGGFRADEYQVVPLGEAPARAFTTRHHYAKSWPAARLRYGLHDRDGRLVGVAVLGIPMTARVLTGPFPALEPYTESLELSRLVLLDEVPANAESWFTARVFRAAAEEGVRGVVAYSDPVPRWATRDGRHRLVMPGHVGTVYQALGADYLGPGTPRVLTVLPDGTVLSDRALSKVRNREVGHRAVIARLVDLGAPQPTGDLRVWLPAGLDAAGATRTRHPGNHRYAWRIGPTRAERTRVRIALPAHPYPKLHQTRSAA